MGVTGVRQGREDKPANLGWQHAWLQGWEYSSETDSSPGKRRYCLRRQRAEEERQQKMGWLDGIADSMDESWANSGRW